MILLGTTIKTLLYYQLLLPSPNYAGFTLSCLIYENSCLSLIEDL